MPGGGGGRRVMKAAYKVCRQEAEAESSEAMNGVKLSLRAAKETNTEGENNSPLGSISGYFERGCTGKLGGQYCVQC